MKNIIKVHSKAATVCRPLPYALILISSIVILTTCSKNDPQENEPPTTPAAVTNQSINHTTLKVKLQNIRDEIRLVGTVAAYQEVQISPEISGKIKKIYFDAGDFVKTNDLLAELDNESKLISLRMKNAIVKKAEATGKKARKDARKGGALFKQGVISDSESDDYTLDRQIANAELNLAKAEEMAAEKELRDTKIHAPFDGRIALKNVEIGKLVMPGENLFTLVDIQRIKVFVHVSEMDITKLSKGDTARIVIDSLPDTTLTGKVTTIGLKADDATRTFLVEIAVSNEEEILLPGMIARVIIEPQKTITAVLIPKTAIRENDEQNVAYVLHNGEIERRILITGKEIGEQIIIEKGLTEGEELIVSGEEAERAFRP